MEKLLSDNCNNGLKVDIEDTHGMVLERDGWTWMAQQRVNLVSEGKIGTLDRIEGRKKKCVLKWGMRIDEERVLRTDPLLLRRIRGARERARTYMGEWLSMK